jgi:hypothetical protein
VPRAELTLTVPEVVWIGALSRSSPAAAFRILAAVPGDDAGVGLAEVTAADLVAVLGEVDDSDAVTTLEILQRWEDTALVQFETSDPLLLFPVQGSDVPLEMPLELSDREARWEITAPQEPLSALGQQLAEFGIPFDVERVSQHVEAEQLLTGSRLELIEAAVENGYYDTPRECSLTELADAVGIAKSTCSETLHRAEEKILEAFADERD